MRLLLILVLTLLSSKPAISEKILYIAVMNATSHKIWNTALVTELAERGHKVDYISVEDAKSLHPNIVNHLYKQPEVGQDELTDLVELFQTASAIEKISAVTSNAILECENYFKSPIFKNLLVRKHKETYDVLIIDYTNLECLLPFSHHFNAPMVLVTPLLLNPHWLLRLMGTPIFHAYPHVADNKIPPLGLWQRIHSLGIYLYDEYNFYTRTLPVMEELNKKHFGEGVLPIDKLKEKVAVALVNVPPWINKIPLPTNVIPVAGLHVKEPKILEPKVKKFLDEARNGAIYVSFGSLVLTENLKEKTVQSMLSAVGKLPQRVLWKWDTSKETRNFNVPKNVLRIPWLAQSDVLGHPNMRLFISHCGGQSSLEAVYHGVPVLGLPAFWDQRESSNRFVAANAGIRIDLKDVTEANFFQAIKELTENKTYKEGAKSLQASLRDQPVKPMDLAVFWIEFVTRHGGAPHLRPFLWDMPYPRALLLDVVIVTLLGVLIISLPIIALCCLCRRTIKCFSSAAVKKSKRE